jgi:hypothetical protein
MVQKVAVFAVLYGAQICPTACCSGCLATLVAGAIKKAPCGACVGFTVLTS